MELETLAFTVGYLVTLTLIFGVPIGFVWWRFPPKASRVRTQTSRNYFVRHWRGELNLGVSYWLNPLGVGLAAAIAWASLDCIEITQQPAAYFIGYTGLAVLAIFASIWLWVGIWRSAGRAHSTFWGVAARVMVLFSLLTLTANTIRYTLPSAYESLRIAFHRDDVPRHQLRILNGGKEIELAGGIDFGTAEDLLILLNASPSVTTIDLNNVGGRIAEGVKVRDLIRERRLATYTATSCASACTIAYLGGNPRFLGPKGRLGFHRSRFPGWTTEQETSAIHEAERGMIAAGISREFATKAASFPANDLWEPDIQTLLAAHVITKVTDGLSFSAAAGMTKSYTFADADRDLGTTSSFAALKRWDPAAYASILDSMVQGIRQGKSTQDVVVEARKPLLDAIAKYKPFAGDNVQVMIARWTAAAAIMLAAEHPRECVEMFNGTGSGYTTNLSKELRSRETEVASALIDSGAGQPDASAMSRTQGEAQTARIWAHVHTAAPQLDLSIVGKSLTNAADQRSYCLAMGAFMDGVTTLPPQQAGRFMRYLWRGD